MIQYHKQIAIPFILNHIKELWNLSVAIFVAELGIISFATEKLDFEKIPLWIIILLFIISLIFNIITIVVGTDSQRNLINLITDSENLENKKEDATDKPLEKTEEEKRLVFEKNKIMKAFAFQKKAFLVGLLSFLICVGAIVMSGKDKQDIHHGEIIKSLKNRRIHR